MGTLTYLQTGAGLLIVLGLIALAAIAIAVFFLARKSNPPGPTSRPPSMAAAAEFDVPKSIPITRAI